MSDEIGEAFVFGVDCDGGVAEEGLGAGGGNGEMAGRVKGVGIADVVELAIDLLVDDFEVGEGGGATGGTS